MTCSSSSIECSRMCAESELSNCSPAMIRRLPLSFAIDEFDRNALPDQPRQPFDVPIGQPHATMGIGLADIGRIRRAVNAKAFCIQPDPARADRIVRPRFDGEG